MNKLNIHNEQSETLNGYINVNIKDKSPTELDDLVSNAECVEILALDILDYFSLQETNNILNYLCSKLRHSGTLTVSVNDLFEISRAYYTNNISSEDAINLLFGSTSMTKKSAISMNDLEEYFLNKGLTIIKKRTTNYKSVIMVKRK